MDLQTTERTAGDVRTSTLGLFDLLLFRFVSIPLPHADTRHRPALGSTAA